MALIEQTVRPQLLQRERGEPLGRVVTAQVPHASQGNGLGEVLDLRPGRRRTVVWRVA